MNDSNIKVLVTCSGLGSRLGEITKNTNKSLVRIGNKAAISYIIDSYPADTEFVITLGHFGSHVRQYLEIAHPKTKFEFIEVEKYTGPGSSLAHSLLCAKEVIGSNPFIFNACDTLSIGKDDFDLSVNTVWASSKKRDRSQYRTVRTRGPKAMAVLDKGESVTDEPIYIGKCYIKDAGLFWSVLEKEVEDNKFDSSLSDCHGINGMLKLGSAFVSKNPEQWLDVGNLDELKKARSFFEFDANVLEKYDESIYFVNDSVIKFFSNHNVNLQRVKRTEFLPNTTPKIQKYSKNFMSYKFTEGEIVCRLFGLTQSTLSSLLHFAHAEMWSKESNYSIEKCKKMCREFYIDKTKKRVENYLKARGMSDESSIINGHYVENVDALLKRAVDLGILEGKMGHFHGDFILENIISDSKNFTFIDWRQDFAGDIQFGDTYYDLAKLNHNLHFNHDIVRNNGYSVKFLGCNKTFVDIHCSHRILTMRRSLEEFCQSHGYSMSRVDILTGIIWINMSPLHDANLGDFLYNFGKLYLQRAIENEERIT